MDIPSRGLVNRYIAAQGPLEKTCGDFWQVSGKLAANWLQTGCKLAANWLQTGCKLVANWLQTGCKLAANWLQTGCKLAANWLQTGCKLAEQAYTSFSLASLQMVWEQDAQLVIMLTTTFERGRVSVSCL